MKSKYTLVISGIHKFRVVQIIFYNQKIARAIFYDNIGKLYWWFTWEDLEVLDDST